MFSTKIHKIIIPLFLVVFLVYVTVIYVIYFGHKDTVRGATGDICDTTGNEGCFSGECHKSTCDCPPGKMGPYNCTVHKICSAPQIANENGSCATEGNNTKDGTCKNGTCISNNAANSCCACAYQDYKKCAGLSTTNKDTKTNKTECESWINPLSGQRECGVDSTTNKCVSAFKIDCDNQIKSNTACKTNMPPFVYDSLATVMGKSATFFSQNNCNPKRLYIQRHGTGSQDDCEAISNMAQYLCMSCPAGNCNGIKDSNNVIIYHNGCGVASEQPPVDLLGKQIKQWLIDTNDKTTTVRIAMHQETCKAGDFYTETLIIEWDSIKKTYFDCSLKENKFCFIKYESTICTNSETGQERTLMCGPKGPVIWTWQDIDSVILKSNNPPIYIGNPSNQPNL